MNLPSEIINIILNIKYDNFCKEIYSSSCDDYVFENIKGAQLCNDKQKFNELIKNHYNVLELWELNNLSLDIDLIKVLLSLICFDDFITKICDYIIKFNKIILLTELYSFAKNNIRNIIIEKCIKLDASKTLKIILQKFHKNDCKYWFIIKNFHNSIQTPGKSKICELFLKHTSIGYSIFIPKPADNEILHIILKYINNYNIKISNGAHYEKLVNHAIATGNDKNIKLLVKKQIQIDEKLLKIYENIKLYKKLSNN